MAGSFLKKATPTTSTCETPSTGALAQPAYALYILAHFQVEQLATVRACQAANLEGLQRIAQAVRLTLRRL